MGKSPGKWIKAVLFGKKSSKSNLSKDVTSEKGYAKKESVENVAPNPPLQKFDRGSENTELEKGASAGIICDSAALSNVTPEIEAQVIEEPISADDAELRSLELAATKAQAAFRGYLARRAFRALKGIIRLQALIRGHLVRRQAVATLRCMQAVVRVQALARGRRARLSYPHQVLQEYNSGELKDAKQVGSSVVNISVRPEKLTASAFVCKLLAAVPIAMPLSLQYDLCEPNSVCQWLERWSLSRFWEPLPQPKKVVDAESQRIQSRMQTVETEPVRSKRSVRKVLSAATVDASTVSSFEAEKPRRNIRKITSHQIESVQDQPQNELERVKRNLRKVTAAVEMPPERSETEIDKAQEIPIPVQTQTKAAASATSNVGEPVVVNSSEKMSDSTSEIDKLAVTEAPVPVVVEEQSDVLCDHPTAEQQQLEEENAGKSENSPVVNEELSSKEDQTSKERTRRRRSLPSKQENSENISQNTPSLPSYMAATESAKAKLKAQGSLKVSEDGADNGVVRRHSLPSSTNGKLSSLSPRVQRPVQANGKSGNKNNKSMSASKDEKVLGWRR